MKHLLLRLLPYNTHLYNFCKSYVEKHDGDCNGDMMTNGELPRHAALPAGQFGRLRRGCTHGRVGKACAHHPSEPDHSLLRAGQRKFRNLVMNVACRSRHSAITSVSALPGMAKGPSLSTGMRLASTPCTSGGGWRMDGGWKKQRKLKPSNWTPSSITVPNETFEEIDFLKVDVEGHELEVFKGGESLFRRRSGPSHPVRIRRMQYRFESSSEGYFRVFRGNELQLLQDFPGPAEAL